MSRFVKPFNLRTINNNIMNRKLYFTLIFLLAIKFNNAQTPEKKYYWAGSSEFIFSLGNLETKAPVIKESPVIRFSGFFNYQSQFHYNFSNNLGFYTGLGIRNIGFINKLDDSIKVKQRVYSFGIPLAVKIGNMDKSAYAAFGGELELFFNYKQKTFYGDTKSKFNDWFSDRTDLLNPSVFLELKEKRGGYIRFKYYLNDFLNPEKQTITVNNIAYPFYPVKSNLFYISIGSTLKYKELKSKRSFREKKT